MTTILGTYGNTRRLAAWEYMGILGSIGLSQIMIMVYIVSTDPCGTPLMRVTGSEIPNPSITV